MQQSLTALANHYGSDKGTEGPSPAWLPLNYTDVYEAYLAPIRHEKVNILEVGMGVPGDAWESNIAHGRNTGGGASIKMWHDYFPNGQIFGADINPAPHLDGDRVKTFVLDQGDPAALNRFVQEAGVEFDLIIDDGSHRPDHQQITLSALFPHLKPGALYFVEDLLANGQGDRDMGRFSATSVANTRRVLREFAETGSFGTPNALDGVDALKRDIESVAFHVPRLTRRVNISPSKWRTPKRAVRPITHYRPDTEMLAGLRKRQLTSA
jgi:hypothetical protein